MREAALVDKYEGPLFSFPDHLVSDPKDKAALLSYLACGDSLATMHELIKKALAGEHTYTLHPSLLRADSMT